MATAKVNKEKCGTCTKVVSDKDRALQCEVCEMWFHIKCLDMNDDTYQILLKNIGLHWYCSGCEKGVAKILTVLSNINKRQDKLETIVEQINTRVCEITKGLDQVRKDFADFRNECAENRHPDAFGKQVEELTAALIHDGAWTEVVRKELSCSLKTVQEDVEEKMEIERRKSNLMIFGIKENDPEQDVETLAQIMQEALKVDYSRHVDDMIRVGKFSVVDKPRPIKIKIKTIEGRKEILSRAKMLKDCSEYKGIFIAPDLTRKQQALDRELRGQLKTIRDGGRSDAIIKGGKVVSKNGGEVLYAPVH